MPNGELFIKLLQTEQEYRALNLKLQQEIDIVTASFMTWSETTFT